MKVLILTYTYPPSTSVNGLRPYHFAKALEGAGHAVEVFTRHFTGHEKWDEYNKENSTPFSISIEEGILVYRTPYKNTWFKYYSNNLIKNTGIWKIIYLTQLVWGRTTQESYNGWFYTFLRQVLSIDFDLVLVESGPTNMVRLAAKVCDDKRIPFVIDFRDVYYHEMLCRRKLPWNKRIKIFFEQLYMNGPINKANAIIGESDQKLEALKIPGKKAHVIHNGYDEALWANEEYLVEKNDTFIILVAGRIYALPFLNVFLDAFVEFLAAGYKDVLIRFIAPGNDEIINLINKKLGTDCIEIIPNRVSAAKAIQYMNSSHVVAYHGWQGYTGVYSTKIYDYIRSGKRILICPSDHDVLEEMLRPLEGCFLQSESSEAAKILVSIYNQWKFAELKDIVRGEQIKDFSRQNQAIKIVKILENAI